MPYLVDGNNLIGAERGGRASKDDQEALRREISDRLRATRARVVLFFDGGGNSASLGSLSVRHSGASTADDAIVREVERSSRPQEMIVVTADQGLARRTRDAGGRTISIRVSRAGRRPVSRGGIAAFRIRTGSAGQASP